MIYSFLLTACNCKTSLLTPIYFPDHCVCQPKQNIFEQTATFGEVLETAEIDISALSPMDDMHNILYWR